MRAAEDAPCDDDLRSGLALRLQQHGIHMDGGSQTGGARLQRLSEPDLAAIFRHRGIIRHVLRLEGRDLEASPDISAA